MSLPMFRATVNGGLFCMEEIWKDVVGYEGLYQVSSLGRIKALAKLTYHNKAKCNVLRKERMFRQIFIDRWGYKRIGLTDINKKHKGWLAHRVVAMAFHPNPENKGDVNHKNGIKTDNRAENLEWATRSENCIHSFTIGLQDNKGQKHPMHKLTSAQVLEIRAKYKPYVYERKQLAKEYGVDWTTIKDIVNNKTWMHL